MLHATTRRLFTLLLATLACLALTATARADGAPVEPYASYQPQGVCSPKAKPGTQVLGHWVVRTYGGGYGRISERCAGRSVSEHKEGRAFDWSLNAAKAGDRARALRFMRAVFATGPSGERAELARRMGIMYLIWNDHIYASYDQFGARAYRSSSCRNKVLAKCSRTLRHRDHVHISLTRAGGWGRTSWYAGRLPATRAR